MNIRGIICPALSNLHYLCKIYFHVSDPSVENGVERNKKGKNKEMNIFIKCLALAASLITLNIATPMQAQNTDERKGDGPLVVIHTPYGDMTVRLYDETPRHRDNFIKLVKEKQYDSTLFHRVIEGFMIQGGDPGSKHAAPGQALGSGDLGYTIPAEFVPSLFHKKGALAAARTGDQVNPEKRSSSCQFYIVQGKTWTAQELQMISARYGIQFSPGQIETYTSLGGTPFLDTQYTVFGEVVDGLDVIDKIASQPTLPGDRPVEDIRMTMTLE